jgi:hypothetical protein
MILIIIIIILTFSFALSIYGYKYSFAIPSILAVLLPFQLLFLIIIYNVFNFQVSIMNIIASWKELVIFITLLLMILYIIQYKSVFRTRSQVWSIIDIIILVYLAVNIAYIFLSLTILPFKPGVAATLNGFRMQGMMPLAYITGRLVTARKLSSFENYLKLLVLIGTFVSIIGIVEVIINPLPVLSELGMKKYLIEIGGLSPIEFTKEGGVTTYFAHFDSESKQNIRLRRSASLFLSPLSFGQFLIIIIPISLILVLNKKIKKRHLIIQSIGLLTTISRGPIAAVIVSCSSMLLFVVQGVSKKQKRNIMIFFFLFIGIIIYNGMDYIHATITLKDPSAASRMSVYVNAIQLMINNPFGLGLGASDSKFTREETIGSGESEYFENVSRIGWLGLLLYFLMHFAIIIKSYYYSKSDIVNFSILSAIIFGITVGLFTQEFVNRIWKNPFLVYIYGWTIGAWVTYYCNETRKALSAK